MCPAAHGVWAGQLRVTDSLFLGYALNAVDAKNRLSVPASFREVVTARSESKSIVVALAERANCLVGYDAGRPATVKAEIEERFAGDFSETRDNKMRTLLGTSEEVAFDDNGRIVMSSNMRDFGEIEKLVLFWGMGDFFEIWNPHLFLETPGLDPRIAKMVRKQLAARGEA